MKTIFSLRTAVAVSLIALAFASETTEAKRTPSYYKCSGRVAGDWSLGLYPSGCDASSFIADSVIWNSYRPLVLDERSNLATERARYAQEMNALLREASQNYLRRRNPNVSSTELAWWTLAIQTVANQESGWSHYRFSQGRLKMMRGDSGHGHGLMQIDDRGHFPAIQNGTAANLMGNLTYAFDLYYRLWQAAPSKGCVRSPSNYEARLRAAWSAYNSGSNFCRWQTRSRDHQKDEQLYAKFRARPWTSFVGDPDRRSSINVDCLIDHPQGCGRGFASVVASPAELAEAGDVVRVVAPHGITLREENGAELERVPNGRTVRVEAVVKRGPTQEILYRVTEQGRTGYLHAGQLLPTPTLSLWTARLK